MKKILSFIFAGLCFLGSVSAQNPTLVYSTNGNTVVGGPVGKVLINGFFSNANINIEQRTLRGGTWTGTVTSAASGPFVRNDVLNNQTGGVTVVNGNVTIGLTNKFFRTSSWYENGTNTDHHPSGFITDYVTGGVRTKDHAYFGSLGTLWGSGQAVPDHIVGWGYNILCTGSDTNYPPGAVSNVLGFVVESNYSPASEPEGQSEYRMVAKSAFVGVTRFAEGSVRNGDLANEWSMDFGRITNLTSQGATLYLGYDTSLLSTNAVVNPFARFTFGNTNILDIKHSSVIFYAPAPLVHRSVSFFETNAIVQGPGDGVNGKLIMASGSSLIITNQSQFKSFGLTNAQFFTSNNIATGRILSQPDAVVWEGSNLIYRTPVMISNSLSVCGNPLPVGSLVYINITNNTDALYIDRSGNRLVEIGQSSSRGLIGLKDNGSASADVVLGAGSIDSFVGRSGGKFGVGTSTPQQLLHVSNGNVRVEGSVSISNGTINVSSNIAQYASTWANPSALNTYYTNGSTRISVKFWVNMQGGAADAAQVEIWRGSTIAACTNIEWTAKQPVGLTAASIHTLQGFISPGEIFIATNQSGATATASFLYGRTTVQ